MLPVRVWGLSVALGFVQIMGTYGASQDNDGRIGLDPLGVVLVLVGPLSLLLRERRPLVPVVASFAALDVYLGTGRVYGPIFLSVIVALVNAGQTEARRPLWGLAGLGLAGYAVAHAFDPRQDGFSFVSLSLVVGWLVGVLAVAEVVRVRREQGAARSRARVEHAARAAEQQRLRVAQELHDVLAHHISLINVQAGVALHLVDEQPEQARTALANIKGASKEALSELRAALDVLRHGDAAPTQPAPTLAELPALVEAVRAGGLAVDLQCDAPEGLPAAVQLAAYRIVQEALTNVTRHAGARRATVRVGRAGSGPDVPDVLEVTVTDDGHGGVAVAGNGISGMAERASALGGSLSAGPGTSGFVVVARLPT